MRGCQCICCHKTLTPSGSRLATSLHTAQCVAGYDVVFFFLKFSFILQLPKSKLAITFKTYSHLRFCDYEVTDPFNTFPMCNSHTRKQRKAVPVMKSNVTWRLISPNLSKSLKSRMILYFNQSQFLETFNYCEISWYFIQFKELC